MITLHFAESVYYATPRNPFVALGAQTIRLIPSTCREYLVAQWTQCSVVIALGHFGHTYAIDMKI
jgi:hypothetical protein